MSYQLILCIIAIVAAIVIGNVCKLNTGIHQKPSFLLVASGDAFSLLGLPACRFIASSRIL